ncbi:MAG: sugar phosphate isomerase/epimerase, partial [Firmicutes bacterium]|nr:sugar phosphate isomerase/epimerase [Bacillota bacterium]
SDEAAESLGGQIAALKRNGIFLTELRSIDGINISRVSEAAAKEAKKALDGSGIKVWALGSPYGKVSLKEGFDEKPLFDQLRRLLDTAGVLGCDKLRVFSFYDAYEQRSRVFDLLSRSVEIAAGYGAGLYHENEKDIYGDVPERVLDLAEIKGLHFVYDPANYVQSGVPSPVFLKGTAKLASYHHIKDMIAKTGEIVPAGEGDADIPGLIGSLREDTVLTVEPHLSVFSGFSALQALPLKTRHIFQDNDESFDAAVSALKRLLIRAGYSYDTGSQKWIK